MASANPDDFIERLVVPRGTGRTTVDGRVRAFALEATVCVGLHRLQHFDGDLSAEGGVLRGEDRAEAAFSEQAVEAVSPREKITLIERGLVELGRRGHCRQ